MVQPTYGLVIGRFVEMFDPSISPEEQSSMLKESIAWMVVLTLALFFFSYGSFALLQISSERLSFKLRARYLNSLMRQEVKYFEKQQIEALPSKLAETFTHISEGSGEKVGQLITTVGATISGAIIGLIVCPYYALCLMSWGGLATFVMIKARNAMMKQVMMKMMMNGKLGAFTEEMISSLKLIISFGKE